MTDVSIIISNYNYGRYLSTAIESALEQTLPGVEVIVVDDGSTDDSAELIESYRGRVRIVSKENGGQASALNAGFAVSNGRVIIFLDADDVLEPTAAAHASMNIDDTVAKAHWRLRKIDAEGDSIDELWPRGELPDGDFRERIVQFGPAISASPPTSGNAWSRRFLERVMPIPEVYRLCADDYLYALAPAFGVIRRIDEPQSQYRVHGTNNYLGRSLEQRIEFGLRAQVRQCQVLASFLRSSGIACEPDAWLKECWFYRVNEVCRAIEQIVPPGESIVLIDEDLLGANGSIAGRTSRPFTERNGEYWGPPANDDEATGELARSAGRGASYVTVVWSSFWFVDAYPVLRRHLENDTQAIRNDDVIVFRIDDTLIASAALASIGSQTCE